MTHASVDHWSLRKSLAFLAATFAMAIGVMMPAAVAASPAFGTPIVLCSGAQVVVVYDDGQPAPIDNDAAGASFTCAMALLSGFAAPPPPECGDLTPPDHTPAPKAACHAAQRALSGRYFPRPHSTAPPIA